MSLEQKIEELTAAVDKLTAAFVKGGAVTDVAAKAAAETDGEDAEQETKPKRKRRTKAEIEADKKAAKKTASKKAAKDDEDDDLGDDLGDDDDLGDEADDFGDEPEDGDEDEGADEVTADSIRDLLMRVKDEKGADKARSILADVGVKTIAQIPEAKYAKVIQLAKKMGVKA